MVTVVVVRDVVVALVVVVDVVPVDVVVTAPFSKATCPKTCTSNADAWSAIPVLTNLVIAASSAPSKAAACADVNMKLPMGTMVYATSTLPGDASCDNRRPCTALHSVVVVTEFALRPKMERTAPATLSAPTPPLQKVAGSVVLMTTAPERPSAKITVVVVAVLVVVPAAAPVVPTDDAVDVPGNVAMDAVDVLTVTVFVMLVTLAMTAVEVVTDALASLEDLVVVVAVTLEVGTALVLPAATVVELVVVDGGLVLPTDTVVLICVAPLVVVADAVVL